MPKLSSYYQYKRESKGQGECGLKEGWWGRGSVEKRSQGAEVHLPESPNFTNSDLIWLTRSFQRKGSSEGPHVLDKCEQVLDERLASEMDVPLGGGGQGIAGEELEVSTAHSIERALQEDVGEGGMSVVGESWVSYAGRRGGAGLVALGGSRRRARACGSRCEVAEGTRRTPSRLCFWLKLQGEAFRLPCLRLSIHRLQVEPTMESKSSSFKKAMYMIFSGSSPRQQLSSGHLNAVSSGTIEEYSTMTNSAIQTSLAALKEGSALASRIPYIAPIAGILLQVLTMRDEVKQYKQECEVVMRRLTRVAGLLINVGQSCQTHELEEGDLPVGLRAILQSLQSELDGIERVLWECTKARGVRGFLLRKDLLGNIKRYDAELLNVLQAFQAELSLDIRFAQIVERREPVLAPPPSQIFFGRDAEVAQIFNIIFANIGSRPARIAILGPGGYGKTTLANAVLSHDRIQKYFQNARYFISCESATSSDALLIQIAKALSLVMGTADALWSQIHATLNSKETILCLDNFESPWDQPDETKHAVEILLSRITALRRVTILVTMRGAERPGQTEWTRPFLEPLRTLNLNAAKEIWQRVAGSYDDISEKLIVAVDYVPLAVNLLAHLSQVTPPTLLWRDWSTKRLKAVKRGQTHRLSNLEYSIQLSIDNGLHMKQLDRFEEILGGMDVPSSLQVLQHCSLVHLIGNRYQPHPIIRQFCNNQGFTSSTHKTSLEEFYITLASFNVQKATPEAYGEMVLEVTNTKAILSDLFKSNFANQPRLIDAVIMFTELCMNIGDFSSTLLNQAVQMLESNADALLLIQCLKVWGRLYYFSDDMESAKQKYLEAEKQCLSSPIDLSNLHGSILTDLGLVYLCQLILDKAEASYKKALELHEASQNISGQGHSHYGLGKTYVELGKFTEAEASFQKALEFHKATDDYVGQGNDFQGLGETYQRQNKLAEAEASYKKALEFQKMANHILNQGNAHLGLGHIYKSLNKFDEAEASFHKALEFHIAANDFFNQGIDHQGLGDIYLALNKMNEAEVSFKKALEFKKAANDVHGQGIALSGLGRVYMKRSQLEEAKAMFEEALMLHRQILATNWEEDDQKHLNNVLSKMRVTLE
ncbi:hypothetical protein B0F90DRAFT_1669281 [Multifurca ochricompacta]|uniref:Tetratricopeptide repeat protein 29 n=1 Tax=Multifurca ochricompacta TaxID=376703 RepID=A0AAD4QM07_9AGAM|nr:hypothetical protein B0F90DRAFT_1669281 [Multifurca ochricompacta]